MEYTFPVGIFSTKEYAIEAAKEHRAYRGGKYDHKLFLIEEGVMYDAEECKGEWVTGYPAPSGETQSATLAIGQ